MGLGKAARILSASFAVVASGQIASASEYLCPGTGNLTLERWDQISLTDPTRIPFSQTPSAVTKVALAESPRDFLDSYGHRMRGYICAPVTGNYTFYISGDDQVRLYLSTDTSPANKKLVAYHDGWTNPREWNKYPTQKSVQIQLEGGKQYYIEALQVEQGGGDNLAVGWSLPSGTQEAPIPGLRLSATVATTNTSSPQVSGNVVQNPGFESGSTAWEDWGSNVVVTSGVKSGTRALRVGTGMGGRGQPLSLTNVSGRSFTVSAAGRVSVSGERGWVGVHFMSGGKQQKVDAKVEFTGTSYAIQSSTFTVPAGTDALRMYVWKSAGSGYFFADDISLVETSTSPLPSPAPSPSASPVASCSGSGGILLQRWDNLNLTDPFKIPFNQAPNASSTLSLAEAPSDFRDSYGHRMSGTICVPSTGDYTFYVSGDDQTSLYLGTDSSPASKRRIAYHVEWTNPRQFDKYATQKSAPIRLEGGRQYYIEAIQVEQGGGDNLAIAWRLPDGSLEAPIPGSRLSPASGMTPSPTPTATATSTPSPTPTPTETSTGDHPSPAVPVPNVSYSGPFVITKGGTYKGNWQSTDSEIPAVDVRTSEPVIIDGANIRGAGFLIKAWYQNANITVRNTRGYGLTPTVTRDYSKARRFITVNEFKNVVIENNYMESTAGIHVGDGYVGNRTPSETIRVRYNKARNIDGRIYGGKSLVQFFQVNFRGDLPHAEIAFNEIINEPGKSAVEDNINIFNSRGVAGSPIRIHNNYIQGAYPPNMSDTKYSGGGIISDADGNINTTTTQIEVYENHLVNVGNYSLGMASGNNLYYHHNRIINSGRFFGTSTVMPFYQSGMWSKDYYGMGTTFSNRYESNTCAVLWGESYRHCISDNVLATWTNNSLFPSGNPTIEQEMAEYPLYLNKLRSRGVFIGPRL